MRRTAGTIERLGMGVGVDGDAFGTAGGGDFSGARQQQATDATTHVIGQHPEMLERPRLRRRREHEESDHTAVGFCDPGQAGGDAARRDRQIVAPGLELCLGM